ncbi:MAG: flagellar basal body L-ring protein FlgH [Pseudomonadota bacterium]
MTTQSKKHAPRGFKLASLAAMALMLSACGTADRIANIGKEPEMSKIENPQEAADYRPVSLPMPTANTKPNEANSLWQADRQTFFKDQRASNIGDILTVMIDIQDEAELENASERSRSGSEDVDMPNMMGIEDQLTKVLPEELSPEDLVNMGSTSSSNGSGSIGREEEITLKLAAMVTEVLPNGNMVIYGRQEVRVNYELREIKIAGVIRPEDIQSDNTISHEKIAEARIAYGGRGHISEVQKPRYGQEFFDIVFPF